MPGRPVLLRPGLLTVRTGVTETMKIRLPAALAAAACFATPASAQDFSGFRIEGRLGWESTRATTDYPVEVQIPENEDVSVSGRESAVSYGLEAGYDAPVGERLIVGVYGGFDLSGFDRCGEAFGDDLGCVETGRTFTAGVRAGVPVGSSLLLYAKGGYSNGRVKFAYDSDVDEEDEQGADVAGRSRGVDGYHLGAGAELAFGRHLYGKLEYLFTDLGTARFPGTEAGEPTAVIDSRRHQLVAGIGLRF